MRKSLVLIVLAAVATLLVGCGSGGSAAKLAGGDVAVVGGKHIPKSDFDALIAQARRSFQQQGRKFPKQGTTDYQTLKGQAVALLVQQAERQEKAKKMGIEVSGQEVEKRLAQIKQQYFKGSEKAYKAQLAKQHLTDAQVREDVRAQLISEKVFAKVSKDVKVSDKQVHDYYVSHASLYQQPQTRDVRYILVGPKKSVADSVYRQLVNGTDKTWCTLAKRYAKDSSGQSCGKATFSKGQTVAVFDKKAFTAPAHKVVPPFYDPTQYKAWFVIEPLGPVKPKSVTPEKQVAESIRQQLLQQEKNQAMSDWVSGLAKDFCSGSRIKYQVGYAPNPDPCAVTTTSATTTTR